MKMIFLFIQDYLSSNQTSLQVKHSYITDGCPRFQLHIETFFLTSFPKDWCLFKNDNQSVFFFFKLFCNEMEHEYKQITVYPASSSLYL